MTTKAQKKKAQTYTKGAILASQRYRAALDALTVLLDDGHEYTFKKVDEVLADFGLRPVTDTFNRREN